MFFYGFDWSYLILVLPAMIFSLWAGLPWHDRGTGGTGGSPQ